MAGGGLKTPLLAMPARRWTDNSLGFTMRPNPGECNRASQQKMKPCEKELDPLGATPKYAFPMLVGSSAMRVFPWFFRRGALLWGILRPTRLQP